jgi:hypothetical protein
MNDSKPGPLATEMLLDWEGAAQHNPAAFAADKTVEGYLADPGLIAEASAWVAGAMAGGVLGNAAYEAVKAKVSGFLAAWRQRHGVKKLDDLQDKVLHAIRTHHDGNHMDDELEKHLKLLFQRAAE